MEQALPFIIGGAVVLIVILLYMRAVGSRKGLRCKQCGEYMRIELMSAEGQRCNTCGAPLDVTEERHAQS